MTTNRDWRTAAPKWAVEAAAKLEKVWQQFTDDRGLSMTRALSTILAGWLLVTDHGGTVAWYETKEDCEVALQAARPLLTYNACIPDRFAVEELRRVQEAKP